MSGALAGVTRKGLLRLSAGVSCFQLCEVDESAVALCTSPHRRGDCESVGCGGVSAYAPTEDTRARICHLHEEVGMVKVRDRIGTRGEESACIKQASFAMDGGRYPKFCNDHRQENMINIRNQRCRAAGCSKGASFAATGGERGQFCSEHKGKNLVNTRRRRSRCMAPGCTSRGLIYVIDGQQLPKSCVGHRGPDFLLPHPDRSPRWSNGILVIR
ncbi:unnamed protein product [Ectocarpus sp. CCAP 1310/34]|nr:unnamed protein product [Ectocarpus sp. CCAP 1310/34]